MVRNGKVFIASTDVYAGPSCYYSRGSHAIEITKYCAHVWFGGVCLFGGDVYDTLDGKGRALYVSGSATMDCVHVLGFGYRAFDGATMPVITTEPVTPLWWEIPFTV